MTGEGIEPLLERSGELQAISEVLAAARAGTGACLLVRGPAGIGKSRLLGLARVEGGQNRMTVLAARGAVLEREYPFGVVLQLLGPIAADDSRRQAMLAGAARSARTVFEPDHVLTSGPDATFAVVHGLFWAIANLSTAGPVLVCVDDLQWGDELSLRFLDFLARRADDLPLALVFAVRGGEGTKAGAGGVLEELVGGPLIRTVAPAALSEAAVLDLTRARFGAHASEAFANACWSATGGNPLYLAELHRQLIGENVEATSEAASSVAAAAPRAVGPVILARLGRLGERAVRLARALAVLGDRVLLPDTAELAGLSREEASEAAHTLFAAGVVGAGRELTFTHPLLRDVLYADVPEVVRGEYHARAARILDQRGRPPESVVAQLLSATAAGDRWVVERLRAAARRAINQGGPAGAVTPLQRALSEPPADSVRPAVLLELGEAEAASGRPAALEHLAAARESLAPGSLRASAALALAGNSPPRSGSSTRSPPMRKRSGNPVARCCNTRARNLRVPAGGMSSNLPASLLLVKCSNPPVR